MCNTAITCFINSQAYKAIQTSNVFCAVQHYANGCIHETQKREHKNVEFAKNSTSLPIVKRNIVIVLNISGSKQYQYTIYRIWLLGLALS